MNPNRFSEIKISTIELTENILFRVKGIISLINEENWSLSFEKISFVVEDLGSLIEGIQILNENDIMSIDIAEMNEKLSMLMDAVEQHNYLLVRDIFNFEVFPLLEFWMESQKND